MKTVEIKKAIEKRFEQKRAAAEGNFKIFFSMKKNREDASAARKSYVKKEFAQVYAEKIRRLHEEVENKRYLEAEDVLGAILENREMLSSAQLAELEDWARETYSVVAAGKKAVYLGQLLKEMGFASFEEIACDQVEILFHFNRTPKHSLIKEFMCREISQKLKDMGFENRMICK